MKTFFLVSSRFHPFILGAVFLTSLCMFWPSSAAAHRVSVFAWIEGDTVYTRSKFSGGKRVKDGDVLVYDLNENHLLSGKTDELGEFSYKIPRKTGMKIVIKAGSGHRGEWSIPLHEVEGLSGPEATSIQPQEAASTTPGEAAALSRIDLDELRRVIEESVDSKLKPVLKILIDTQEAGPSFRDILGGIGYIFGLMGLAAYIHFRRKVSEAEKEKAGSSIHAK